MAVIVNIIYKDSIGVLFAASFALVLYVICNSARVKRGESFVGVVSRLPKRIWDGSIWLFYGPDLIEKFYSQESGDSSFKISTPVHDLLFIRDKTLAKEMMSASPEQLSLHGIARDIMRPEVTIPSFVWSEKRQGAVGSGYVRALRSLLTSHLPYFQPKFEVMLKQQMRDELAATTRDDDGWGHINLVPMMRRTIASVTCLLFFGEELSQDLELKNALIEFPLVCFSVAELTQCTPNFLHNLLAYGVTRGRWAEKMIFGRLIPVVQARLEMRARLKQNTWPNAPTDMIQWVIQMIPAGEDWDSSRVIGQIMSLWVAALFQPVFTSANMIKDLAIHQQYVEPLREEIREKWKNSSSRNIEDLPRLDSFLRESIRHNGSEAITGRRKVLEPVTFSDGSTVLPGDWVCVPQLAMMRDSDRYGNPLSFDGFRFLHANEALRAGRTTSNAPEKEATKLTDASWDWPIWGLGHLSCPGRWFASMMMKLVAITVIENYDVSLLETSSAMTMTWRASVIPRDTIVCKLRESVNGDRTFCI